MSPSRASTDTIALAAVCLAASMFSLEISSVPVILPTLEKVLNGDFKDLQWIMNAYTIACTTVLMAAGAFADRYGRKRIFLASIAVFGVTSLICGLAPSAPVLIAARFLQGVGGGAMLICLIAILSHQFRGGPERTRAFAAWGIVLGAGLGFGPIVGATIAATAGWPWVFLVHVPLSVLALALAVVGVKESRDPQAERLDVAGVVTLSLTVFGLAYVITQGPELGFDSAAALGIVAATAASFVAFVVAETRNPRPMFDFQAFRIRAFSGALLGSTGMNFSFWPFIIYLPIYFQSGLGYDVVAAGLSLLAYTLPTLIVPPFAERLSLRYEPRVVIPAGLFVIGLGFLLMRIGSGVEHASWATMFPGALIAGVGLGLTNTPVTNTTTGSLPGARAGMASGIDMSARLISLAVNIAVMGVILQAGVQAYLKNALPELDALRLRTLAERVASGSLDGAHAVNAPAALVRDALTHGFGLVMLYGGIAVWALAALSYLTFGRRRPTQAGEVRGSA